MVKRWLHWHLGACALDAGHTVIFVDHGLNLTTNILGSAPDPYIFIWF